MLASSWLALAVWMCSTLSPIWVPRTGVGSIRGPVSWEVKQVFPSEWLARLPTLLGWRQLRSLAL